MPTKPARFMASDASFSGFPKGMVQFFRELTRGGGKNNNRDWFQEHKAMFEDSVKAPMVELVGALNAELAASPVGRKYVTEPKKAIYRIYRDTRFSADKTPYKDHIGATFTAAGMGRHNSAGVYFGISHNTVEIAAGIYMPEPEQLLQVRTLLAERHDDFRALTEAKAFRSLMGEVTGDKLQRVPKGFPADHTAAELLKHKAWYFYQALDPEIVTTPKLFRELRKRFLASLPLLEFLNEPLAASAKKKAREARMFE